MLNRSLMLISRIFGFLFVQPLVRIIFWKRRRVPPIEDQLLHLAAVDIAAKIRKREITSRQIVQLYVNRIKEVNVVLNAVVDERYAQALSEAEAADQLIAKSGNPEEDFAVSRPFLGVPFTVKENIGLAGLSQCVGMVHRKGVRCSNNGPTVDFLIKAGGIPLCVTNTPEYSLNLESCNNVTGRTLNPYDTRRTPGGSSGGEGALLGAGASTFGVSSDVAGSIRLPSLNCGIFGIKPTSGLLPLQNYWPPFEDPDLHKFFSIGVMARYAKDLKPVLKVMLGENVNKLTLDKEVEFKQLKVFFIEDFNSSLLVNRVHKELVEAVRKTVKTLGDLGSSIYKLEDYLDNVQYTLEITTAAITGSADMKVLEYNGKKRSVPVEYLKASFGCSDHTIGMLQFEIARLIRGALSRSQLRKSKTMRAKMQEDILNLLDDNSIIVCPTFCQPALYHYELPHHASGIAYLLLANIFGLPGIHIPMGIDKKRGLPFGVQVLAGPGRDHLCLEIAQMMEKKFGGWKPPQ